FRSRGQIYPQQRRQDQCRCFLFHSLTVLICRTGLQLNQDRSFYGRYASRRYVKSALKSPLKVVTLILSYFLNTKDSHRSKSGRVSSYLSCWIVMIKSSNLVSMRCSRKNVITAGNPTSLTKGIQSILLKHCRCCIYDFRRIQRNRNSL